MLPTRRQKVLVSWLIFLITAVSHASAGEAVKTIDAERLHSLVVDNAFKLEAGRKRQFVVIDARDKQEYDASHVFSAFSIPEKEFETSAQQLPEDKSILIVVYDDDRNSGRSKQWAIKAANAGYANVLLYSEPFTTWKTKGMPIVPVKEIGK